MPAPKTADSLYVKNIIFVQLGATTVPGCFNY